jgi:histidinol-phosphate aminotransferase
VTRIRQSVARLAAYAPGEQPADPRVVKLNTNENPYPPSPRVAEALHTLDAGRLRLYPDPNCLRLREAIGRLHGCRPEQVFVGNGSDEVLELCTRAFVENDGAIGYLDPSYSLYPVLADIREVARRPLALDPGFAFPGQAGPADCALFFLTDPNAPTGMQVPRPRLRAFCAETDAVVVLDEAYVDFAANHAIDLALELDNVLVARTLSKAYSLAGLRVGYAVGSEPLIAALFKVKDSYNLDTVSQALAREAILDQAHMRANVARVCATRARLCARLTAAGMTVYPSQANFVWAEPGGMEARALFEALRRRGILVRYFPGARTERCVRITVGTDEQVDALLAAVGELVGRPPGQDDTEEA